ERSCPITADNGPSWSECSGWHTVDLKNLRGVGNEVYWGYGAFAYARGGAQWLSQSMIGEGGGIGWARECPITPGGVAWGSCSGWDPVDLTSLRGVGGEAYRAYGAYVTKGPGRQTLTQSVLT